MIKCTAKYELSFRDLEDLIKINTTCEFKICLWYVSFVIKYFETRK